MKEIIKKKTGLQNEIQNNLKPNPFFFFVHLSPFGSTGNLTQSIYAWAY